ncbi:hypothetical protein J3B02_000279 [Coemansia erecta]|uniref:Uncharacterized protein n=1 Tax=Coemansia asiatica TaxID=1052880 RepID=A0A9W7XLB8_9FUNG|nr:hypothetical protein LPJ64_003284 [Coemansia asiatica]KAJ2858407.1 hypothetical protein J3B02_000279 [Coemansia erecta]KAJ2887498.1 hypothetical protein FB639_001272 [Coemansia asiatica]
MEERSDTWIQRMRRRWSIKKHKQQQKQQHQNASNDHDQLSTHDAMSVEESLPAYTAARAHSITDQQIHSLSDNFSLGDIRVVRVGKDVPETRKPHYTASTTGGCSRGYSYYYQNDPLLYTYEKREIPDDAVPYLDDCDYEHLAARIARQQSLLQRNLHRVSMLLSRRPPAGML